MEPLLDSPATAKRLGITERHLRELVVRRDIPFVRVGRLIRFVPADLETWVAENRTEAAG
jgi:excisionase family DNA binding protein